MRNVRSWKKNPDPTATPIFCSELIQGNCFPLRETPQKIMEVEGHFSNIQGPSSKSIV